MSFENTKIPKFRRCVLQNFPFIEADFDALTDYQLLCKVVEYLNKVIDQTNSTSESMNQLNEAFVELKNYVDHYFDNLDVQEEINNKLDDMAEQGQLADIVAAYIQLKGILAYDTVADMKIAENLVNGSFAETYGFYAKGDKGSSKYKIRTITNDDVVDESTIISLYDDTLIAELIPEDSMNVLQFGVQDDTASIDYTSQIQTAIKYGIKELVFNSGTYTIDDGLEVTCCISGDDGNQTTISFPTADWTKTDLTDSIFYIFDQKNIEIKNIKFLGTFDNTNPGSTSGTQEHAHAIALKNAQNIEIHDCEAQDIKGDFVYVGGGRTGEAHEGLSKNVNIYNNVVNNIKRCCTAYINCEKVRVANNNIYKPFTYVATFDIEPNDSAQTTEDITIEGNTIDTNGICFQVYNGGSNNVNPKSLFITDNYVKNCSHFFNSSIPSGVTDPYIDNGVISNNYCANPTNTVNVFGFKNLVFSNNNIANSVSVQMSNNVNIENNNIKGVILNNSSNVIVNGNILTYKGYSLTGNCVAIVSGENYYITNNIMKEVRAGVRIQLSGNLKKATIKHNNIITSKYGVYCYADSTHTYENVFVEDNNIYHDVQGDTNGDVSFVSVSNSLTKQANTSNYFSKKGYASSTTNITGIKGQYVDNTNPTLLSDADGSYYLKGWFCVDAENQTWIEDKLRV